MLSREIQNNLKFETFKRYPPVAKKTGSLAARLTGGRRRSEESQKSGDVLCATEMFGGKAMVFATDHNLLFGYDFENKRQYSKVLRESFVTCLEFCDEKGWLIAGHSDNIVNFIDPRQYKFKVMKTFYDLTAFPPIQIKLLRGVDRMILVNSVNEVSLCERAQSKTLKYNSRGIIRAGRSDPLFDVQVLEFSQGAIAALTSESKVRLIWISFEASFDVRFLESIRRPEPEGGEAPLQEQMSFTLENFSITKKTGFSLDIFGESKRESQLNSHFGMSVPDLIMLLKKKAKPSYGRSSIFLMSKNLWRSTGEKMFSVSIFGKECEVSFSIIGGNGAVMKFCSRRFAFDRHVIYAAILGVEMILILFENLEFCFLHIDQFRQEKSTHEVGVIKKGSLFGAKRKGSRDTRDRRDTQDTQDTRDSRHSPDSPDARAMSKGGAMSRFVYQGVMLGCIGPRPAGGYMKGECNRQRGTRST